MCGVRTILPINTPYREGWRSHTQLTKSVAQAIPRTVPFALHCLQLCEMQLGKENKHGRQAFCMFNPIFYFNQYVCLLTMRFGVFFFVCFLLFLFFLPSSVRHAHHKPRLVCGCLVVWRNVPYLCSSLIPPPTRPPPLPSPFPCSMQKK